MPPRVELSNRDEMLTKFIAEQFQEVNSNPESGLHRGRLAMAYDANGFREEAVKVYAQAHALSPNVFLWPYLQAHLYAELGEIDDALQSVDHALRIDAKYGAAYISQGVWLLDSGQYEKALNTLQKAQSNVLDGTQARAMDVYSALTHFQLGNPEKSRELLEPYIQEDMHPQIARQLSQTYRALGLHDLATKFSIRSVDSAEITWTDPKAASKLAYVRNFSGSLRLAEELIEHENPSHAIAILEDLLIAYPDEESVINNLGIAYKLVGERSKALDLLIAALVSNPRSHLLHFNIAVIYEELNETTKAIAHLGKAIEMKPNLLPAYERKIQLLINANELAEAYDVVQMALNHVEPNFDIYYWAGILAGLQDEWPQSTLYFQHAVSLDATNPKAHENLIRSLLSQARFEEAETALREVERSGLRLDAIAEFRRELDSVGSSSLTQQ